MKKTLTFIFAFFSGMLFSQIPNAGFENWTTGEPDGWNSLNMPGFTCVVQSATAHSGLSALRLQPGNDGGSPAAGMVITGDDGSYHFPVTGRPVSLKGWYILNSASADSLICEVGVTENSGTHSGNAYVTYFPPVASWTPFTIPITYTGGSMPMDSMHIRFEINNLSGSPDLASFALIDDLELDNPTDAMEPRAESFFTLYPNPASEVVTLMLKSPLHVPVHAELYHSTGQLLKTLNWEEASNLEVDLSSLPAGMYFVKIFGENAIAIRSFVKI